MAAEHIDDLELYGLNLTDVHEMLELVLINSFFVFDGKIYQQMIGLFMGCKPSPIGAIVRVYTFERRSVYTDPHYLPVMYGRYVDDAGTVTSDEERTNQLFNRIAEEDPDSRLSWEIDFPQTGESFTPFLCTQIRVDGEGHLHYKYYRKPQKKAITLHSRSHHPYRIVLVFCPLLTNKAHPAGRIAGRGHFWKFKPEWG